MSMYKAFYSDQIYKQKYNWGEYSIIFVSNLNKPCSSQLTKINGTNPELNSYNPSIVCSKMFSQSGNLCAKTYQTVGLLEKEKYFNEDPDIFCVVLRQSKVVGTLGYCYHNLPIRKTYHNLKIEKNAHELIRLAIDLKLGYRIEVLSEKIIKMRGEENKWKKAKRAYGYRYKKISMVTEVGEMLFKGMLNFYKNLVKKDFYEEPPPLWISTHGQIINFYKKILGKNIFQEKAGKINWSGIPQKSHKAYKNFDFKPYKIKLWELSPEFRRKKTKKEIWDINNFILNIPNIKKPLLQNQAMA